MATLVVIFIAMAILMVVGASLYHARRPWVPKTDVGADEPPRVTVLVPAYNEERTLANCIDGLVAQDYSNHEVLVIDDGSTDATYAVAERLAHANVGRVRAVSKLNGGKAGALNYGLLHATGEIVVVVDADSILAPDALTELTQSFADPDVVAVGGNVRIANRRGLLTWLQAAEYVTGLTLQRSMFAQVNGMQVISGALGAFRADDLRRIGGYSNDTLVEDMDVTVMMRALGGRVVYNPEAIAYTEGPESWSDLVKQRHRWTYGGFQALGKHRSMLFKPRYGTLGLLGLPYFLLGPWLMVAMVGMLLSTLVLTAVGVLPLTTLAHLGITLVIQAGLTAFAVVLDRESLRLIVPGALTVFILSVVSGYVVLKSGRSYVTSADVHWTKLQRTGGNVLPEGIGQRTQAAEPVPVLPTPRLAESDVVALDALLAANSGRRGAKDQRDRSANVA